MARTSDAKGSKLRVFTFNEASITQQYEMISFHISWFRLQINERRKEIIRFFKGHGFSPKQKISRDFEVALVIHRLNPPLTLGTSPAENP